MNFNLDNKKFDLFHPLILVFMVILFLIIAMPMWYFYRKLPSPNIDLYLYIGIGLLFFILGICLSKYLLDKKFNLSSADLSLKNPHKLSLFESYSKNELILVGIVSLGIILQIINIALLGGIPLFSATLKAKAATKIWLISYIIFLPSINILLAKYNRNSH